MFKVTTLALAAATVTAMWTPQSYAQACIDEDGDGWGWDGAGSCRVQAAQAATGCVDEDGDGWGWDGSGSCQITGSGNSAGSGASNSAACVDDDGDGWGWDGQGSCRVGAAGSTPTGSNSQSTGASACIDDDGDGWGWDGAGSCQVQSSGQGGGQSSGQSSNNNQSSNQNTGSGQATPPGGRFDAQSDLVALHFDHGPDPDDGHAAAAGFVVHDYFGLPVVVVGGTTGVYSADRYLPASENLMNQIWGQQWLDGHNNRQASVEQAARRWVGALAAGGDVWVAEGGPSDFTAAVVRMLQSQYPEYNTRNRVHVVQHSVWNEDHALREDLNFVRANTDYIRIEDGNDPNATADLRQESGSAFVNSALASSYRSVWQSAFNYLDPNDKLDFSDTVELLYILNIGTSEIANPDDFARYFF